MFPFSERGQGQITPSRVCFAPTLRGVSYVKKQWVLFVHVGVSECVCTTEIDDISVAPCVEVCFCLCVCVCKKWSVKLLSTSLMYAVYLHRGNDHSVEV